MDPLDIFGPPAGSPSDGPAGNPPASGDVVGPSPDAGGTYIARPSLTSQGDQYYPPSEEQRGTWHGRELFDEELKDPGRRKRLFNRLHMEAGNADKQKKLETLETFLNRGVSRGQNIDEVIDDLNYFPSRIKNQNLTPDQLNEYEDLLRTARLGSNAARYGTGNSGYDPKTGRWVGFNHGVVTVGSNDPRRDRIGIEGPDMGWSGQPDEPTRSVAQSGGEPGTFQMAEGKGEQWDNRMPTPSNAPKLNPNLAPSVAPRTPYLHILNEGLPPFKFGDKLGLMEPSPDPALDVFGPPAEQPQPSGVPVLDAKIDPDGALGQGMAAVNANIAKGLGLPIDFMTFIAKSPDDIQKILTGKEPGAGQKFMLDMFAKAGINVTPDMGRDAAQVGDQFSKGLAGLALIWGSAGSLGSMATNVGRPALGRFLTTMKEAMDKMPVTTVLSELGAAWGAHEGEKLGPGYAIGGGVLGGMSTAMIAAATRKLGQLLGKPVEWAGSGLGWLGRKAVGGHPPPANLVPTDVETTYQKATVQLDNLNDAITEASKAVADFKRRGVPGTDPARFEAEHNLWGLKQVRDRAENSINELENQYPQLRTSPSSAMRPAWIDPLESRKYAEDQVQGSQQQIEDKVSEVVASLPDPRGLKTAEDYSAAVKAGIAKAEKFAGDVVDAYWQRTPKKAPVPPEGIAKELEAWKQELATRKTHESQIPSGLIADMEQRLSPTNPDGSLKLDYDTVEQWISMKSAIRDARRAEEASVAPRAGLNENFTRLEMMIEKGIADAIPDDVTMQQARAISTKYHDLFSRSKLFDVLRGGPRGGARIAPEDTLDFLKGQGLEDLLTMTRDRAMWKRVPGQSDAYDFANPKNLGREAAETRKAIEKDAENGIWAQVHDELDAKQMDTEEKAKVVQRVAKTVEGLGRVYADLNSAEKALTSLAAEREMIEKSALARYVQGDVQNAISRIWNSTTRAPVAESRALMRTLQANPDALEGYRAGMIDELVRRSGGWDPRAGVDPAKMAKVLSNPKWARMLQETLGEGRYNRLERMVEIARAREAGEIKSFGEKHEKAFTLMGRLFGAQYGGRFLNWITGHSTIQGPQLASQYVKARVLSLLGGWNARTLLHEALRNPEAEATLMGKVPDTLEGGLATAKLVRRAVGFYEGLRQASESWYSQAAGGNVPAAVPAQAHDNVPPAPDTSGRQMFELGSQTHPQTNPDQHYTSKGASQIGGGNTDWTRTIGESPSTPFNWLQQLPVNTPPGAFFKDRSKAEAFSAAMDRYPATNPNVEDRRLTGKTLPAYKEYIRSMDNAGFTQVPDMNGKPFRGFLKRASPFEVSGEKVPFPPGRGQRMMDEEAMPGKPVPLQGGGGGYGGTMFSIHSQALENEATRWAQGKISATQFRQELERRGWSIDKGELRRKEGPIRVYDPQGRQRELNP